MAAPIQEPWLRHPAGQALSIPAFVAACCARYGPAPAFSCQGQSLSYHDLDQQVAAMAAWLRHGLCLPPGERVALMLPNLLQFPVAALGILRAGMVLVNLNPRYREPELQHMLQDSGARVLVAWSAEGSLLARLAAATDLQVAVLAGPQVPAAEAQAPALHSWASVLATGTALMQRHGSRLPGVQRDSIALLQYTGGTTGIPRAAVLSHGNLLANVAQLATALADSQLPPGATTILPLPLYHCYGFTLGLLATLGCGQHGLLVPDPRDLSALVRAWQAWSPGGFLGIDTLYRALCGQRAFASLDFSSLQLCSAGGMALSADVARDWLALTGCPLVEGYGLSECAPLVACNTPCDLAPGTVGRPVPGTRLRLVDASGTAVAAGEPGEICVQGPQLMRGYWRQPLATAQAIDAAGWFHTGDVGVLDGAGRLRIIDRLKDLIIVSGFKVYPSEVEAQVCRHPQVREACLVGVDDAGGTQLTLFVVADGPAPSAAMLIDWCRQRLAPYKVPRQVEFRAHLPLSHIGKVLRKDLRVNHAREGPACV